MKILFYINAIGLESGGAERAISNTASYFAEHGWDTILLTSFRREREYSYSNKVKRMSIEDQQVIQSRLKRNISRIRAVRGICKQEWVDVVVSFMAEPNFRAVLATMGIRTKNIISVRTDPDLEYRGFVRRLLGKYLLACSSGAVFQTCDAKIWFSKKLQKRSAVIYNVVDDKFYITRYRGGTDIVSCGRIIPTKNQALLVRSFKKVHDIFPGERLCIYGAMEEDVGLPELIKKLGLEDSVFLMGRCDDIASVLSSARLFVLPSDYEGMPNALMEAMAVGVPSISTDCPCGGPRELFGKELEDMLTPVGNAEVLADKMIELLSDNGKRKEVGLKMKKRAEDFRTDKIGREWIHYVESVCRGREE